MKKLIALLLCICICISALAACNDQPVGSNENSDGPATSEVPGNSDDNPGDIKDNNNNGLDLPNVEAVKPSTSDLSDTYIMGGGDTLKSYYEKTLDDFYSTCKYYQESLKYKLYSYHEMNGNHFATYQKDKVLAHIYWMECESELNIVTSTTGGGALPSKELAEKTGDFEVSVTQIHSAKLNGMGYVTQLPDGSFIIHDGGYAQCAEELWNTLVKLNNNSESNIIIRAWVITHDREDHRACFGAFGSKYGSKVTLETVMIGTMSDKNASLWGLDYLYDDIRADLVKFRNAELLYVHTGMVFNYCGVKLEILLTPDELWISAFVQNKTGKGDLVDKITANNSSVVSRIYTDDYSFLVLGDAGDYAGVRMVLYYRDYLKSDMCQMAHHSAEDLSLLVYRFIKPSILWYPCNQSAYDNKTNYNDVRTALKNSKYTKEIILQQQGTETRYFETAE